MLNGTFRRRRSARFIEPVVVFSWVYHFRVMVADGHIERNMETIPRRQVFSEDDFPLGVQRASHRSVGLHRHAFSELVVVTDGHGIHCTGDHEYPIQAGDAFVIHGDRSHGYDVVTSMVIVNVLFDLARLPVPTLDLRVLPGYHALFTFEPAFRQSGRLESRLQLSATALTQTRMMLTKLEDHFAGRRPGWRFAALAQFMELTAFLCQSYTSAQPERRPSQIMRLSGVVSYLEENYAHRISLDDLAVMAHMSRSTLLRAFKLAFGRSPIDYLIRLRIDRASDLLRQTDWNLSRIAFEVGFRDSNYLSRQFRSVTGMSPRAFRDRFGSHRCTAGL